MNAKTKLLKIAILTEYYNSSNYGGLLQAYALIRILNSDLGVAEQLCYEKTTMTGERTNKIHYAGNAKTHIRRWLRTVFHKFCSCTVAKKELMQIKERERLIHLFADKIPHSSKVYNDDTIESCVDSYDVFIVGSDQVWRNLEDKAYWLEFVPASKIKLSYAASIARSILTEEEKLRFKTAISSFTDVSVREENAVNLLSDCCEKTPQWTLDPTLLLNRNEWDIVCSERIVKEDYLFCYFLGMSKKQRLIASQYAKKNHLKMVVIPYLRGKFETCDLLIGRDGKRMFDVSPPEFISLIKYANCIITDSFHAAVFSIIYVKKFFVFERLEKISMGSRICSLMRIFETEDRYCNSENKQRIEYMNSCTSIGTMEGNAQFEMLKAESIDFLQRNLA